MTDVAVVGSGYWGRNLVRNFAEEGCLKWICDKNSKALGSFQKAYPQIRTCHQLAELLQDQELSGVAIATPAETHFQLAREVLLAGKHVYVEKPLTLNEFEAEELIDLAADKKLVLMVGHLLHYHPGFIKLKELAHSGELGRINYIYSHRLNLGKIRREENILWSFAPHDISMILALAGEDPDSIRATGGYYLHKRIADVTTTQLEFPSGLKSHIFVSWLHPIKEQKLVVVGEKKMAVFDDTQDWGQKLLLYAHEIAWENGIPVPARAEPKAVPLEQTEPLRSECREFIHCMGSGQRPITDGNEGLRVLKVLNTAQVSLNCDILKTARLSVQGNGGAVNRSVGESVNRSVGESVNRSVGESVNRSVGESVNRSVGESVNRSVGESVNRSVGESVNRSVGESVNRSVGESVNRSVGESVNRSVGESAKRSRRGRKDRKEGLAAEVGTQSSARNNGVFVHETAVVDDGCQIASGTRIWHFSHLLAGSVVGRSCNIGQNVVIGPEVEIGDLCKIQNNVSVFKGVTLEDGVFCGPSMVFTNIYNPRAEIRKMDQVRPTLVKKGATLGANCTIVCGVTIGRYGFVGAGAVVTKNVADHALMVGNPAKRIGWMCECGERLTEDLVCLECEKRYEMTEEGLRNKEAQCSPS